ncbi:UNVERIFIED_CONTAM: hypothetical protein RMT77_016499 [Armadillidium vulgare]
MTFKLLCALVIIVANASAHDWGMGSCPSVAPMSNLSIDKFLGLWYVIEQFDTSSTCLTLSFQRTSETTLSITKNRQFYILDRAGLDHTNSYTGTLDIPYASNQGLLRVKWPLNAAGKGDYIIFDTDYDKYAGVYDCQQIAFFLYRQSAAILSRTPHLDPMFTDRVKRRLESFKVDTEEFNVIDHNITCKGKNQTDLNINVDKDTFKNIFSSTADTIKDAANKLAGGVQDIAHTVVDGVKTLTTNEAVKEPAEGVNKPSPHLNDVEILEK